MGRGFCTSFALLRALPVRSPFASPLVSSALHWSVASARALRSSPAVSRCRSRRAGSGGWQPAPAARPSRFRWGRPLVVLPFSDWVVKWEFRACMVIGFFRGGGFFEGLRFGLSRSSLPRFGPFTLERTWPDVHLWRYPTGYDVSAPRAAVSAREPPASRVSCRSLDHRFLVISELRRPVFSRQLLPMRLGRLARWRAFRVPSKRSIQRLALDGRHTVSCSAP